MCSLSSSLRAGWLGLWALLCLSPSPGTCSLVSSLRTGWTPAHGLTAGTGRGCCGFETDCRTLHLFFPRLHLSRISSLTPGSNVCFPTFMSALALGHCWMKVWLLKALSVVNKVTLCLRVISSCRRVLQASSSSIAVITCLVSGTVENNSLHFGRFPYLLYNFSREREPRNCPSESYFLCGNSFSGCELHPFYSMRHRVPDCVQDPADCQGKAEPSGDSGVWGLGFL